MASSPYRVWSVLAAMIITGAMRTVAVKVFYQMGFEKPFFVTILFHIAGLPAFLIYCYQKRRDDWKSKSGGDDEQMAEDGSQTQEGNQAPSTPPHQLPNDVEVGQSSSHRQHVQEICEDQEAQSKPHPVRRSETIGSHTGITAESHNAAAFLMDKIRPKFLLLVLPGILNMVTYLFRWSSVLHVPASVSEMTINGLELVIGAILSQFIRKRHVESVRWLGILIVTGGLIWIGVADFFLQEDIYNDPTAAEPSRNEASLSSTRNVVAALVSIVGAGVFGAMLGLAEELLTQEGGYPVLWVMGNEGLWGLLLGVALYFPLAGLFDEDPRETWQHLLATPKHWSYAIGLTCLFTLAGMMSLFAVKTTSCVTRNIWQHFKAIPVWLIGLFLYYAVDLENDSLGEAWSRPYSGLIVGGFLVMFLGVYIYYRVSGNRVGGEIGGRHAEEEVEQTNALGHDVLRVEEGTEYYA